MLSILVLTFNHVHHFKHKSSFWEMLICVWETTPVSRSWCQLSKSPSLNFPSPNIVAFQPWRCFLSLSCDDFLLGVHKLAACFCGCGGYPRESDHQFNPAMVPFVGRGGDTPSWEEGWGRYTAGNRKYHHHHHSGVSSGNVDSIWSGTHLLQIFVV